jgi:hypothetical protein
VTVSVIVFRSYCVAVGYSDCSVSVKAVSTAAPMLSAHFRFRRHSGPCLGLPLANPVANDVVDDARSRHRMCQKGDR